MKKYTVEILSFLLLLPVEGLIVWHSIKTGENNVFIPVLIGLIIFMVIFFSLKNFSDYRTEKGERSSLLPIVYGTFIIISTIVSLAVIVQLYITASTLWTLFSMTVLIMLWYSFYLDRDRTIKGKESIYINYVILPSLQSVRSILELPHNYLEYKKLALNYTSEKQVNEKVVNNNLGVNTDGLKQQDLSEKNTTVPGSRKDFSELKNYIESRELDRLDEDTLQDVIYDLENSAWNGKYSKSDVSEFICENYSQDEKGFYCYKGTVRK